MRIHTDVDLDSISSVYSESSDEEKDTSRRGHVSCDQYFCTYLMFLLCLPAGILAHRQIRRIRAVRVTLYAQPRRFNRYRRICTKEDANIFDSALSHTRRSDASEKKRRKDSRRLRCKFACGQVSSPRLYRLSS